MDMNEAWEKIDELKTKPELANTPGYGMEELLDSVDSVYWFQLLMEQPQFSPPDKWWFELRKRCDLPWAKLLAKQPQFEKYCHWESVYSLELVKLAYMAPAIFEKRFQKGRPWDLWAFLTPLEKQLLLSDLPQLENEADWDELDKEWNIGNWLMLLACQPRFEKYFDWSRIEKKPSSFWEFLLLRQPQFACHCDLEHLEDWQIRRIKRKQPQLFEGEKQP